MSTRFWYRKATQTKGASPFPSWYSVTDAAKFNQINIGASAGYTVSRVIQDIRLSVAAGTTGTTLPDLWWGDTHFGYSVTLAGTPTEDAGSVFGTEDHNAVMTGFLQVYNPPHVGMAGDTLATWSGGFNVESHGQRKAVAPSTNPIINTGIAPLDSYGFDNLILGFNYHWEVSVFTRVLFILP